MSVTSIFRDTNNNVSLVRMISTDTLASVAAANYIRNQQNNINALNGGAWAWFVTDMIVCSASDGNALFIFTDATFSSLVQYGSSTPGITPAQIQQNAFTYALDTSVTPDLVTVSLSPAVTGFHDGESFFVKIANNNTTTTPNLALNGLAPTVIQYPDGSAVQPNDLVVDMIAEFQYNSSNSSYAILNPASIYIPGGGGGGSPAQLIYVSNDGNDTTGDGTIEKPFATYAKAASVASPLATLTSQYTIYAIGVFNIIGNLTLFPFVNIQGVSPGQDPAGTPNAQTQFLLSGSVLLDATFASKANSCCYISNCHMGAATSIALTFTAFQSSSIIFDNVNFATGATINITGSDDVVGLGTESIIFKNCQGTEGATYTFTTVSCSMINCSLADATISMLNTTANGNNSLYSLSHCYGTVTAFTLSNNSGGNHILALIEYTSFNGTAFTIDGAGYNVIMNELSPTVNFTNGADFTQVALLPKSDLLSTVNVPATNYTPAAGSSYPASSVSGYLDGINTKFGDLASITQSIIPQGSSVSLTTATAADVTSISLNAGKWHVYGNVFFTVSANAANELCWISTTSATLPDPSLYNGVESTTAENGSCGIQVPFVYLDLGSTTTVYLSCQASFAAGTVTACGGIFAVPA